MDLYVIEFWHPELRIWEPDEQIDTFTDLDDAHEAAINAGYAGRLEGACEPGGWSVS